MRRLLLLAPLALAACGGGGTATPVSGKPLAAAADATARQGSEKVTLQAKIDLSGQSLTLDGSGAFDDKAREGELHLSFTGFAGSSNLDEIFKNDVIWLRSPLLTSSLHGKHWIKVDLRKQAEALGLNLNVLTGQTPSSALSLLRLPSNHVSTVGKATIGDVETTHYRVPLGATAVGTGIRYKSVDAWVDDQGLVRQVTLDFTTPVTGSQPAHTVVTMTFSDFGTSVSVTPPPAGEVVDASQKVHA